MSAIVKTGIGVLDYYRENVPTIPQMFYSTVRNAGSQPANTFKSGKEWRTISYQEWAQISEEIALALIKYGVKKGDDIAIISKSCAQAGWAHMAILLSGAVVNTITPMVNDDEFIFIVKRTDVKYIFVENKAMLQRTVSLWKQMPSLRGIICLEEDYQGNGENTWGLQEFRAAGRSHSLPASELPVYWLRLSLEDRARLDYTKSTTGELRWELTRHGEWIKSEPRGLRRILSENLQGKPSNVYPTIMSIPNSSEIMYALYAMIAVGALIKYGPGPSKIQKLPDLHTLRQAANG